MINSIRRTIEMGQQHVDNMKGNTETSGLAILRYRGEEEEAHSAGFNADIAIYKQLKALAMKVEKLAIIQSELNSKLDNFINKGVEDGN